MKIEAAAREGAKARFGSGAGLFFLFEEERFGTRKLPLRVRGREKPSTPFPARYVFQALVEPRHGCMKFHLREVALELDDFCIAVVEFLKSYRAFESLTMRRNFVKIRAFLVWRLPVRAVLNGA